MTYCLPLFFKKKKNNTSVYNVEFVGWKLGGVDYLFGEDKSLVVCFFIKK